MDTRLAGSGTAGRSGDITKYRRAGRTQRRATLREWDESGKTD